MLANSQINADALEGNGGNISILTQGFFASFDSQIIASSRFGLDGNVDIKTRLSDRPIELEPLPINLTDVTQQITPSCSFGINNFTLAGKGGLPENPIQSLRNYTVWNDLRLPTIESANTMIIPLSAMEAPQKSSIMEATTWKINQQGNVELITHKSPSINLNQNYLCQYLN
ncbi:hypothetical protein H1P_3370006 [Hyella patelloides LEGE 07179]|uniref:Filamentous hemagglutinin family outer membrane protein n=1 Tax=Hyella patelloides LEGE 07179 TaxID=945734 RepID=A0A563VVH7_9CYAN|nr:S-layer family protein [Hyella patelloides]VEP15459.1 hypothetical protein H1P_3370006 [Hyella patelloides LEGE 07179]